MSITQIKYGRVVEREFEIVAFKTGRGLDIRVLDYKIGRRKSNGHMNVGFLYDKTIEGATRKLQGLLLNDIKLELAQKSEY